MPVTHHGHDGRGADFANAHELHQALRYRAFAGHRMDVAVVLRDALVQVVHLAEQVTDDEVGVAGQLFQMRGCLLAHHFGLLRQHHTKFDQQAADAVDGGRTRCDKALPRPVHQQSGLLLFGLGRHRTHVRPAYRLTYRGGISSVVLAALAAHAVRRHQLGRYQPHGVAMRLELPRPVVGAASGLQANGARWQSRYQRVELGTRHLGLAQLHLAGCIHTVYGEDVLGSIDSDGQNGHGLPLPSELMRVRTSHHGSPLPLPALLRGRDGEVPFIR